MENLMSEFSVGGLIISALFGAIFGSYATMFIHRLPKNEPCFGRYFGPKSRCPHCQNTLPTRDMVPIFNWLVTRGRCRFCNEGITKTYFFTELFSIVFFTICYLRFSFEQEYIILAFLLSSCLVILIITEYENKSFPHQILNLLIMLGLISKTLRYGSIEIIIYSILLGGVIALISYNINKVIMEDNAVLFMDYIKFTIISAIWLNYDVFIYFIAISYLLFIFLKVVSKIFSGRLYVSFGYCMSISLFANMLYQYQPVI